MPSDDNDVEFKRRAASWMTGVGARHLEVRVRRRRVAILKNPSAVILCVAIGGGWSVVNAVHLAREICDKWANIAERRGRFDRAIVRAAYLSRLYRATRPVTATPYRTRRCRCEQDRRCGRRGRCGRRYRRFEHTQGSSTPQSVAPCRSAVARVCAVRSRPRSLSQQSTGCTPYSERGTKRGGRRSTVSTVEQCGVGDRAPRRSCTVYSSSERVVSARGGISSSPPSTPSPGRSGRSLASPARSRVVVHREAGTSVP